MSRIIKYIQYKPNDKVLLQVLASEQSPVVIEDVKTDLVIDEPHDLPNTVDDQTEALLVEAQAQVEMMLNQAQVQMTTWQKEAQEAGWEAGYAKANWVVANDMEEAITTIHAIIQSATEAKNQFLRNAQTEISQLAVAIARKIIYKELTINPSIITEIVARTIEAASVHGACRIRVHPQDYEILRPHWEAVALLQQPDQPWELVADERMERGGCLIETGGGIIDARLETQLEQISAAFAKLETGDTVPS